LQGLQAMPGRNKLRLELIPGPLWKLNLRSNVVGIGLDRWIKLSKATRAALAKCTICSGTGRLHGHENWKYVEAAKRRRHSGWCRCDKRAAPAMTAKETPEAQRVRAILARVKPLAAEYYQLTGKPLGVTGEIAEYVAAETLGLILAPPRTKGFDAIRKTKAGEQRIQIKGRAYGNEAKPNQRLGTLKRGAPCDSVLLVLLDNRTLEPREMWEAPIVAVEERLSLPGSRARARGALGVREFKRLARKVWPVET